MTSTTSFPERLREFRATCLQALKGNAGVAALYALLQILLLPVIVLINLQNAVSNYNAGLPAAAAGTAKQAESLASTLARSYNSLLQVLLPGAAVPMALLLAVVLCVRLFGYMQNRRSVDLYHALPVGRVPMLLGRWCAGLAVLFVPQAIGFGALALVARAFGIPGTGSGAFSAGFGLLWLFLGTAAAFTFAVFMAVCSGNTMDAVLSILGVNAGYPALLFCAQYLTMLTLPGYAISDGPSSATVYTLFAPFAAAFLPFLPGGLAGAGFVAWWLCFTAALLAASCLLYLRRKSESAEDHFAFPIPKGVIRFLVTAAGGLGFGLILNQQGWGSFLFGAVAGSLIAHVVVEAIYSRGFRRMKRSLPWYGAFLVAFVVFYGILATGCFGYDTRIPNTADVEAVALEKTLSSYGGDKSIYDGKTHRKAVASLKPQLTEPENIARITKIHREIVDLYRPDGRFYTPLRQYSGPRIVFDYKLKNGKHLKRTYQYSWTAGGPESEKYERYTGAARQISEIPEFIESSDVVFFAEPEDLKNIEFLSNNGQSKVVVPEDDARAELFAALRQDLLDRKANYSAAGDKESVLNLRLSFQASVTPKNAALKKKLGSYSGPVYLPDGFYTFFDENSATYRLVKQMNWDE